MEVLKDQNPMCGEMNFLLRVGKSKINMFKDWKSYFFLWQIWEIYTYDLCLGGWKFVIQKNEFFI